MQKNVYILVNKLEARVHWNSLLTKFQTKKALCNLEKARLKTQSGLSRRVLYFLIFSVKQI